MVYLKDGYKISFHEIDSIKKKRAYHFDLQSTASFLTILFLSSKGSLSCLRTKLTCGASESFGIYEGNWARQVKAATRTAIGLFFNNSNNGGRIVLICGETISAASDTASLNVSNVDTLRAASGRLSDWIKRGTS
jgi:hypothetical protein